MNISGPLLQKTQAKRVSAKTKGESQYIIVKSAKVNESLARWPPQRKNLTCFVIALRDHHITFLIRQVSYFRAAWRSANSRKAWSLSKRDASNLIRLGTSILLDCFHAATNTNSKSATRNTTPSPTAQPTGLPRNTVHMMSSCGPL